MTDFKDQTKISDSQATYFELDDPDTNRTAIIDENGSQDFHLVDTSNTEEYSMNISSQVIEEENYEKMDCEQLQKEDSSENLNESNSFSDHDKNGNENKEEHKSPKPNDKECTESNNENNQPTECLSRESPLIFENELKRKASSTIEIPAKYLRTNENDDALSIVKHKYDEVDKVVENNIVINETESENENGKIPDSQMLSNDDNNICENIENKDIVSDVRADNENKPIDNNVNSISVSNIEKEKEKPDQEVPLEKDNLVSLQENDVDGGNVLSDNENVTSSTNGFENNHEVIANDDITDESKSKYSNNVEEKVNNIQDIRNSRFSIEVVFDKATAKPKPKELVVIDDSEEKIILDSSHEESNKKITMDVSMNDCTINNKNESKSFPTSIPNIEELNTNSQNEKNTIDSNDNIAGNTYNDILARYSNHKTNIQTSNEKSNSKNENSMVVVISDSDSSLADDYGKNKYLEDVGLTQDSKLTQIEKEISFNIKVKCLLSIDENSKEIHHKEVMNVLCDHGNTSQAIHHKAIDSSMSTACLADISVSDNKDHSPASVNSNPQLYQLQPTRLSFISTVSSSSSSTSSSKIVNKETQFSLPHGPAIKNVRKHINELNPEDKQNWEVFEKFVKEWKNGCTLISSITTFINNELTANDCMNGHSDLLESSETLRTSTPEKDVTKKEKKVAPRSSRKGKPSRQSKGSKISNTKSELQSFSKIEDDKTKNSSLSLTDQFELTRTNTFNSDTESTEKFFNKEVFAKWSDNNFYPGKVTDAVKEKFKVEFYDGKSKLLLPDFILPIEGNLDRGFSVYVFEDKYASSAMVIDIKQKSRNTIYVVETDEGKKIETTITNLFLTPDQAKLFKELIVKDTTLIAQQSSDVTADNVLPNTRRQKRVTTTSAKKLKSKKSEINSSIDPAKPSGSGIQNRSQSKDALGKVRTSDSNLSTIETEEKDLLGIQDEITSTQCDQVLKGPQNKVKGKVRNRKKQDSQETINLLGPIPDSESKIFKDMGFILTCVSVDTLVRYQSVQHGNDSNSETGTENEDQWMKYPFVRDRLEAQITAGGGKIYDRFEDIPPDEYVNTKHITNVPNLTRKGLLCLSVGIKSYNHQWVIRSCQQNTAIQPAEEELPVGWSLDKKTYIDSYQRPKTKPLEHTIVAIPLVESEKPFVELWKKICENAGAAVQLIENPAKPFMEATVVLANRKCPSWIIEKASGWEIPVLTTTWVVQCLIEGKLCPSDGKKEYKYQQLSS